MAGDRIARRARDDNEPGMPGLIRGAAREPHIGDAMAPACRAFKAGRVTMHAAPQCASTHSLPAGPDMPDTAPPDTRSQPALDVTALGKRVPLPSGELTILDDIGFSIAAGDSVAIVGASGSGKSTLL